MLGTNVINRERILMGLGKRTIIGIALIFCCFHSSAQYSEKRSESLQIPLQLSLISNSEDLGVQAVPPVQNSAPYHKYAKLPLINAVITQIDEETLRVDLESPVRYNTFLRANLNQYTSSFIRSFKVSTSFLNVARLMELTYSKYIAFDSFKEEEIFMTLAEHEISGVDQTILKLLNEAGPTIVRPKMLSFSIHLEQLRNSEGVEVNNIKLAGELLTDPLEISGAVNGIILKPIDQVFSSYSNQNFMTEYIQVMNEVRARIEELESRNWLNGLANKNWKNKKPVNQLIEKSSNVVRLTSKKLCRIVFK